MTDDETGEDGGREREPLLELLELALEARDDAELSAAVEGWWALEAGVGAEALSRRLAEGNHDLGVLERHRTAHLERLARLEAWLSAAGARGELRDGVEPRSLALLLTATLDGLLMRRLLEPDLPPALAVGALKALLANSSAPGRGRGGLRDDLGKKGGRHEE